MSGALITSSVGILAVLLGVATFWFSIERHSSWKIFRFLPPLVLVYFTPILLTNLYVIPTSAPLYLGLAQYLLPALIVLLLVNIDLPKSVRILGKGFFLLMIATGGVMAGAVVSYTIVHPWLAGDSWKGFGALAGSWIGGTGNMAAVAEMLGTRPEQFGLVVMADGLLFAFWLPVLLGSRNFADRFNAWARVPASRLAALEESTSASEDALAPAPSMLDYLYLALVAVTVTWIADVLSPIVQTYVSSRAPLVGDAVTVQAWRILLVTTIALVISVLPGVRLRGANEIASVLIYVYAASIGARAVFTNLAEAPVFLLGAAIWILIHGIICVIGARILRVDLQTAAIASAANIGGVASAPIVAAHLRAALVPVSILMAIVCYSVANYLAFFTAHLARAAAGQ
ncbi:DUF819 family protein [Sphingosinicella rhizophila]|uniref:DUF819 family protein n=1 Tax=Sphingosinicella rhizophila TaxID=3050082 RepID=A0ABU3Q8N8_9SPHN|nr:DUF819 family protein [Sphingosinicella sp. GR2756]MDT9599766.1 DUF819 family protein [Sphingosinicella sp. GR2756]